MAQDDFYLQAGSQRLAQLEAERAAALADLAAYKANGDQESAAVSIQQIANLDVELQNLNNLYWRYQASVNPPRPPQPTLDEIMAKPWDRMSHDDMYRILKAPGATKHGLDDNRYAAGIVETARRRARGE